VGQGENEKPYDLEERAHLFAKQVRAYYKRLPRTDSNVIDGRQLIRSSGSVGANYIEANEALGKKDFVHRLRIARREAKESRLVVSIARYPARRRARE
jgi:four helix bundle protein